MSSFVFLVLSPFKNATFRQTELQRPYVVFSMFFTQHQFVILIKSIKNKRFHKAVTGHRSSIYTACMLCVIVLLLSCRVRKHHLIISVSLHQPQLCQVSFWKPAKVKVKKYVAVLFRNDKFLQQIYTILLENYKINSYQATAIERD